MKFKAFLILFIVALGAALLLAGKHDGPTLSIHGAAIRLMLADTEAEQERGLGGRDAIQDDEGMLFEFPKSDTYGIWMKGMRFPLDILWLKERIDTDTGKRMNTGGEFVVVDMKENVMPETYPEVFLPKTNTFYVLEIKGGIAHKDGIGVGSILTFSK